MKLTEIFKECKAQWINAINEKNHPFKTFVLSTIERNEPKSRSVILRGFDSKKMNFTIYSDLRSNKIKELNNSSSVQLLFYNSISRFQIIVRAQMINMNSDLKIFNSLTEHSKKNYTSSISPGKLIQDPYDLTFGKEINFCQLVFKAISVECLQLKKSQNIRSYFELNKSWKGFYIAP